MPPQTLIGESTINDYKAAPRQIITKSFHKRLFLHFFEKLPIFFQKREMGAENLRVRGAFPPMLPCRPSSQSAHSDSRRTW
jgi:hypothetical protein